MNAAQVFLELAVILVVARAFAELVSRFGVPAVIGELSAGVLLGPSLLGWFEATDVIRILAEIGVILLLFEVGLETDFKRLTKAGRSATVVALGGFLLPLTLGFALSYFAFGHDTLLAMFVGGTLTATSIGVTVRVLRDIGRQNSREGQIVLGAAVIDDILGVVLLALLYEFSRTGELNFANVSTLVLYIGIFFLIAPLAARLLSFVIGHYHQHTRLPGLVATIIVSLVLSFAWLAHVVGAPQLLGGFAAGLALSRRFFLPFGIALARNPRFAAEVERDIKPIIQLFTPIFFVTIGLSLDLRIVDWGSAFIWTFSVSMAAIAVIAKMAGGYFLVSQHWLMRTSVGMSMVPRGEVGLVFAELGRAAGIFDPETYAAMIVVIAYTTLFTPFWIKLFYRRYGDRPELQ